MRWLVLLPLLLAQHKPWYTGTQGTGAIYAAAASPQLDAGFPQSNVATGWISTLDIASVVIPSGGRMVVAVAICGEAGNSPNCPITISTTSGTLTWTQRSNACLSAGTYQDYVCATVWTAYDATGGTYTFRTTKTVGASDSILTISIYSYSGASQTIGATSALAGDGNGTTITVKRTLTTTADNSVLLFAGAAGGSTNAWTTFYGTADYTQTYTTASTRMYAMSRSVGAAGSYDIGASDTLAYSAVAAIELMAQ